MSETPSAASIQVKRVATTILECARQEPYDPETSIPLLERESWDIYDSIVKPAAKYGGKNGKGLRHMPRYTWDEECWEIVKAEIRSRGPEVLPKWDKSVAYDMEFQAALKSYQVLISVMGPHAGEAPETIFARKVDDVQRLGRTFWLVRSPKARADAVAPWCAANEYGPTWILFVEPSVTGGARPTTESSAAREFLADGQWHALLDSLSPVTGKLDSAATALVLDKLIMPVPGELDLWRYMDADNRALPVRFSLGCSTARAYRRRDGMSTLRGMTSRYRCIAAVGRLASPFAVKVR
jgi:hypothetical protein